MSLEDPFAAGHRGDTGPFEDQLPTQICRDRVAIEERQPADLLGDAHAGEQPMRIAHRPAVLEAEVDVLELGRDVGEIDGLPPGWEVVTDEAPTGAYTLHGLWDRLPD